MVLAQCYPTRSASAENDQILTRRPTHLAEPIMTVEARWVEGGETFHPPSGVVGI